MTKRKQRPADAALAKVQLRLVPDPVAAAVWKVQYRVRAGLPLALRRSLLLEAAVTLTRLAASKAPDGPENALAQLQQQVLQHGMKGVTTPTTHQEQTNDDS